MTFRPTTLLTFPLQFNAVSGGREILRIPVNSDESVESLGKMINEMADKVG